MTGPFVPAPSGQNGQTGSPYPNQQQPQYAPPQQMQPQVPYTQNVMPEPHVSMPAPYFAPPQQQQPQQVQQQQQGNTQFPQQHQQVNPQQPQFNPAWQGGGQVQQQPQQPSFPGQQVPQPRQPQTQQQVPAQGIQFDQSGRMFGPGLPQELQGKTMNEALGMYGVLRQAAITQQRPQQQVPQPQQQTQQQQQQRPASNFFTNPEEAINRALDQRLAPLIQRTQQQDIEEARNVVARMNPNLFAQYEAAVYQKLQGLPAETLSNPKAWQIAFEQTVGEAAMRGQMPVQQQQQIPQPPQQNGQAVLPWQAPQQPAAFGQQQFFSESPSAVMQGGLDPNGTGGAPTQLSGAQMEVARRMGLTPQQYIQGMGARY